MEYSPEVQQIIIQAQSGKHSEFRFLRTWSDYRFYKKQIKIVKQLQKSLTRGANEVLSKYTKSVLNETSEVTELLVYRTLVDTIAYYDEELKILLDITLEYEAYLMDGNFFYALLGNDYRPYDECYDRRGMRE